MRYGWVNWRGFSECTLGYKCTCILFFTGALFQSGSIQLFQVKTNDSPLITVANERFRYFHPSNYPHEKETSV